MYSLTHFSLINQGLCVEFAEEIVSNFQENDSCSNYIETSIEEWLDDGEWEHDKTLQWDVDLLKEYNIKLPASFTFETLQHVFFPYHVWIVETNSDTNEQLFYDAECSSGVSSFFDLPIFQRTLEKTDNH